MSAEMDERRNAESVKITRADKLLAASLCGILLPREHLEMQIAVKMHDEHAEACRIKAERDAAEKRVGLLEKELEHAAAQLQTVIPAGQLKAIGLLEVSAGIEQLTQMLRAAESERDAAVERIGELETELHNAKKQRAMADIEADGYKRQIDDLAEVMAELGCDIGWFLCNAENLRKCFDAVTDVCGVPEVKYADLTPGMLPEALARTAELENELHALRTLENERIASLESQLAACKTEWTKRRPTVEGLYWRRVPSLGVGPSVYPVFQYLAGQELGMQWGGGHCEMQHLPAEMEFCGPLVPPAEPPAPGPADSATPLPGADHADLENETLGRVAILLPGLIRGVIEGIVAEKAEPAPEPEKERPPVVVWYSHGNFDGYGLLYSDGSVGIKSTTYRSVPEAVQDGYTLETFDT